MGDVPPPLCYSPTMWEAEVIVVSELYIETRKELSIWKGLWISGISEQAETFLVIRRAVVLLGFARRLVCSSSHDSAPPFTACGHPRCGNRTENIYTNIYCYYFVSALPGRAMCQVVFNGQYLNPRETRKRQKL